MSTPDSLERQFTLLTAVARYDHLRTRDAFAPPREEFSAARDEFAPAHDREAGDPAVRADGEAADAGHDPQVRPLSRDEALELLALGELIARKAGYGRQLAVRTARAAGASWSQIGAALGTTKQSAWEAHTRWLTDQAASAMD